MFYSIIHWYLKKNLKKNIKLSRSCFKTGQNVIFIFFSYDGEDKRDGVKKQPSLHPYPHPNEFWTKLAVVS